MGEKKRKQKRLERFKEEHPFCCLCGGGTPTESIEHAPPVVLFWDKQRPKGMEVPACDRCNQGSRNEDQLAAMFTIMQSADFYDGSNRNDEKVSYLLKRVSGCKNNIPNLGNYFSDIGNDWVSDSKGVFKPLHKIKFEPRIFDDYLYRWAAKQAIAHWYLEKGSVFSQKGVVAVRWLTNFELVDNDRLFDFVSQFTNVSALVAGQNSSKGQFYVRHPDVEEGFGAHVIFCGYHGTATMCVLLEDQTAIGMLKNNSLGRNSAMFKTDAANGIHQIY